jgi:hypothetical protein
MVICINSVGCFVYRLIEMIFNMPHYMLMKKLILVLLSVSIFTLINPIQVDAQNWDASVDFMLGAPQGGFKQNVDALGYGIDLLATYQLPYSYVAMGLDIGFLTYGTSRRTEPFSPDIPEVRVQVRTNNNIAFFHFLTRIQPGYGNIRPYMDALAGFNYLFTESTIRDQRTNEDIAGSTNFDDIAFSAGLAAGSKFHLFETVDDETGWPIRFYLDLRARYLIGGNAEYLKEGSIQRQNGNIIYEVDQSRTDILTFHLGFGVQF